MSAKDLRLYFELQRTAHLLRQEADAIMQGETGISMAQAAMLTLVNEMNGARQNVIAKQLAQREAAVTQMASRLIDKGLLRRTRAIDDKRAWELKATAQGKSTALLIQKAMASINTRLDSALSEKRASAFAQMLEDIRTALGKIEPR